MWLSKLSHISIKNLIKILFENQKLNKLALFTYLIMLLIFKQNRAIGNTLTNGLFRQQLAPIQGKMYLPTD